MAAFTLQPITDNGFTPAFTTPGSSMTAVIGSGYNTFLVVRTSGTATSVVVTVPGNTFFGVANTANTIALGATAEKWIPLRKAYDDGTGTATITFTPTTGVTAGVVVIG